MCDIFLTIIDNKKTMNKYFLKLNPVVCNAQMVNKHLLTLF